MPVDFSDVEFSAKKDGRDHWPKTMDELVVGWIALATAQADGPKVDVEEVFWAWEAASDLTKDHPDLALQFVLKVFEKGMSEKMLSMLAAGPLEDLLERNGAVVIDRIETMARQDPKFRDLLGGVWQNAMSNDLWQRVERAANRTKRRTP